MSCPAPPANVLPCALPATRTRTSRPTRCPAPPASACPVPCQRPAPALAHPALRAALHRSRAPALRPSRDLPCSPRDALPCSPRAALPCSPRDALPCSPHAALPCAARCLCIRCQRPASCCAHVLLAQPVRCPHAACAACVHLACAAAAAKLLLPLASSVPCPAQRYRAALPCCPVLSARLFPAHHYTPLLPCEHHCSAVLPANCLATLPVRCPRTATALPTSCPHSLRCLLLHRFGSCPRTASTPSTALRTAPLTLPCPVESLSPQQLREWAIRWGNPGGGASRARWRKPLSPQQRRDWAVRCSSPGGGAWGATTGGTCESTPAGSAAGRRGGSWGGQQQQQHPPETLSLQQLREWAVRWGSPGDRGFRGTRNGGVEAPGGVEGASLGAFDSASTGAEPKALHTFTLDSGASCCFFRDSTTVTPLIAPVPVTLSAEIVASCSSLAPPYLPCVEGRQRAAPHSSFPPTTAPLQTLHMDVKAEVPSVLIRWIRALRLELSARFRQDLPVLWLHSDRGGEFSSRLLEDFCGAEGIRQSFMLPTSPQQNGIAECHISLVMEVACTSMIHAAAPHFLWPFAVRYAVHQLNLWHRVSVPETLPTLRWTGEVGNVSAFWVWGYLSLVRDLRAGKLSPRTLRCVFLGFPTDAPFWRFYHLGSHRMLSSRDVTFDESVCFYRLHPHRCSPPVVVDAGAAGGGATGGAGSGGAGSRDAECPTSTRAAGGAAVGGAVGACAGGSGARWQDTLSPERLCEWAVRWGSPGGGARRTGDGGTGGTGRGGASAGVPGIGGAGGANTGGADTSGATGGTKGATGGTGVGGASRQESLLPQQLRKWDVHWGSPELEVLVLGELLLLELESQLQLLPHSPLPAPTPYSVVTESLNESREPASRPVTPVRTRRVACPCPPPVPGTHTMALRPSSVPHRVVLPSPPASSLPDVPDSESDLVRAASLTLECLVAAAPHLASTLLCPEGDPDALDILTPRSYTDAITGPYSSKWQIVMDEEMASWNSIGNYVDAVPPPGANIVDGMWIFRVKRSPGSPPAFKARYVARSFRQRGQLLPDFLPHPEDDHSSGATARCSTVLHRFGFQFSSPKPTPLPTGHSLSAPPLDKSVEPGGPYPELVGCLMYLMTCTRPDLAYPLSLLARYVAHGIHRKLHWEAAKRVGGGAFCRAQGIRQTFTLPASPQQNGIAERRIGMVMDVARTSMIHAAAPHFLWPFAVQYAAHQLNLQPRVSLPETSPTLLWTGKVGDASAFRVWGSRAFVRDLSADKLSPRAVPCVFLGFPPDAPGWQFYHPTSRRVLSSQDVTFDESVPYYRLFPYRTASLPPPPLFLTPGPPPVDPLPPQGPAPSGVSQVDAVEPVEVAVDSGAATGAEPAGAGSGGAGSGGAEAEGAETGGAEPGGTEPGGAEPGVTEPGGAEPGGAGSARVASRGASSRREVFSPRELREWFARRWSRAAGAGGTTATTGSGGSCPGGAGAAGPGGTAEAAGVGPPGGSAGATGGTGAAGSTGPAAAGATGVGATGGVGAGGFADAGTSEGAGGATGAGAPAGRPGAVLAGSGGAPQPRPYFVPLLEQVLGLPPSPSPAPPLECPQPVQSQSLLQPVSPLPSPSPYTGPTGGLAERRAPASRPASPARPACTSHRTSRPRPPAVPGTHQMALRPSTAPLRVPFPSPPASSLPAFPDPESDSLRAASPTVARFLATVVTDPSLASTAASALVAELVDFAASCRLDYAASLVAESASVCPPFVGGKCALSTDVLEDR
ncbi:unnamed protein product [Closterium sp. NIES-53]